MTYSYDRRRFRLKVGGVADQLVALGVLVEKVDGQIATIIAANPEDRIVPHRVAALLKALFELARRVGAGGVFLEILREYEMPPAARKVIERAAKKFSQSRTIVKPEKAVAAYPDTIYEYRQYIDVARSVLQKNEKHKDEGATTTTTVGSFTLINTGGFPDKVMAECAKVVARSEKLLRQKGLGKVCYGDVHVTNTVHKSTRVLAFYMLGSDTLYIRANLKGKLGPAVQSMVHELGHRLQFRFLRSKKQDIDALYRSLGAKQSGALHDLLMDRSRWPKAGDTYLYKGETFLFERVDLSGRSKLDALFRIPGERFTLKVPLSGYISEKDPGAVAASQTYVTNYASTDPDENFAEMVAFYCEDKLPSEQIKMLEEVLS